MKRGFKGGVMKHAAYGAVWCAITACVAAVPVSAAPTPKVASIASAETVDVPVGQQQLIKTPASIERVAIGDPETAGVNVTGAREVMVTGKKRGDTSLIVWMAGNSQPTRFPVAVGAADKPSILDNGKRQTVGTQVQTDIQIAEVSRNTLRQIGFNFVSNPAGQSAVGVTSPGSSSGIDSLASGAASIASSTGFQAIGDAFNLLLTDSSQSTAGILSILERRGLSRILAQPSLVAMSGQTATFLAGGEFPVPVVQSGGGGGASSVTIQYKQFGIQLALTPTVLSNDRIVLKIAPSVSELDYDNGVTINGTTVPGLAKRRTDTTVELGDGQSFILSGLVDHNLTANVDKIPWLGDVPILGAFFRSTSYQRRNRELIMVVTPHLVTPLAKGTKVKLPGEEYDQYDPSSGTLFFGETGDFKATDETGFSH